MLIKLTLSLKITMQKLLSIKIWPMNLIKIQLIIPKEFNNSKRNSK